MASEKYVLNYAFIWVCYIELILLEYVVLLVKYAIGGAYFMLAREFLTFCLRLAQLMQAAAASAAPPSKDATPFAKSSKRHSSSQGNISLDQ